MIATVVRFRLIMIMLKIHITHANGTKKPIDVYQRTTTSLNMGSNNFSKMQNSVKIPKVFVSQTITIIMGRKLSS